MESFLLVYVTFNVKVVLVTYFYASKVIEEILLVI